MKFNKAAREKYLAFAKSPIASWSANFRDLNASITRMSTLADSGRITEDQVSEEIVRLKQKWRAPDRHDPAHLLKLLVSNETLGELDYYDQLNLINIINVCHNSQSMAVAGRKLFNKSRENKKSTNDSHRVKQLLSKFDITFENIQKL